MLDSDKVSKENFNLRFNICRDCENFETLTSTCKSCGCFMDSKCWVKYSQCPIGKWGALVDSY